MPLLPACRDSFSYHFTFFLSFVWRLTDFLHALCDWSSALFGVAVHVALRKACVAVVLLAHHLICVWHDSGPDLQSPWMSGCLSSSTGASQLHLACFFTPLGTLCPVPLLFPEVAPDCQCGCFEHPLWLKHSLVISMTILPKCPRLCPMHWSLP